MPSLCRPLWDFICLASILGIWPRFVEPSLIFTTKKTIPIPNLSPSLQGLKIAQISDLHFNRHISHSFLDKIVDKVKAANPDLIVFTGDFLCYGQLQDKEHLATFLNRFHAPYGCYAIAGNHDYSSYVSINDDGEYDLIDSNFSVIHKALQMLLTSPPKPKAVVAERVRHIPLHPELIDLLSTTPFTLLHNKTIQVDIKGSTLNVCGLGEYILGRLKPEEAFTNYDTQAPGIILLHNPDGIPKLMNYPGEVTLCGHTHGGQINLPWLWKKFTLLENMQFKSGEISIGKKWGYVNKGIGSTVPFRWFSPPELLLLTLENQPD